jgi:hypothetical protein
MLMSISHLEAYLGLQDAILRVAILAAVGTTSIRTGSTPWRGYLTC